MHRDEEIDKELRFHLDEQVADLEASGVPPDEARRRAQLEFGGVTQTKEATREHVASWPVTITAFWQDVRYSARRLAASPGFAVATVATLALGIGANTAIFTIVNAVLLRPLPVPDADRIVLMADYYPNASSPGPAGFITSSVPDYYDRLRTMTVYDEQAVFDDISVPFQIDGKPVQVPGVMATPSFFRLLRVPPMRGRIFEEREGEEANRTRMILSHGLALDMFGSIDAAIGRTVRLTRPFTVIGVMPPGFEFGEPGARFWIPLVFSDEQKSESHRHSNALRNVARLKPGATLEQAQAQLNALNAANMTRFPQFRQLLTNAGYYTSVDRFHDVVVRGIRPTLQLLWGGALVVMLVCGVNVASLALARASARTKELATRLALGAGRVRVMQLLMVEGLLLGTAGGISGLALGAGILRTLSSIGLDRLPRASEISVDGRVVGVALVIALGVGLLMGLAPFVHFMTVRLGTLMDHETRTGSAGRQARIARHALVVAQIALTFVLLMAAGLLLTSFRNLLATDPGFVPANVITGLISIPTARYGTDNDVRAFTGRVFATVHRVPGVTSAGGTTVIPLGGNNNNSAIFAEHYHMKPGESVVAPTQIIATPGYFDAIGTRLRRGRYFTDADTATAPPVVIVDDRLAARFWPAAEPIGKRMHTPTDPEDMLKTNEHTRWLTVVGVVREVQTNDLAGQRDSVGAYYFPAAQYPPRNLVLTVKTAADPVATLRTIRAELAKLDPTMPLSDVRTMTERTALSLMPRRTAMLTALWFAGIALFLSALGIYGVLAYVVAQRTREIGIRIALGSTASGIFTLVLREGALLVAAGLTIGLAGAVVSGRVIQGQIYGVSALDPSMIGLVIAILGATALLACALPARRATRLDPVLILSQQ